MTYNLFADSLSCRVVFFVLGALGTSDITTVTINIFTTNAKARFARCERKT